MNQGQQQPSRSGVLSHLSNIFGFPTPRVKKLLNWRQGDEDDKWAQTAVEVLVKRIQKVRGKEAGRQAMEDLERALANPDAPSNCITIPRSMDGRIQVSLKTRILFNKLCIPNAICFVALNRLVIVKVCRT